MSKELFDGTPSSLSKVVADSPLGIGFFDEHGRWLHVNPSLINLLGFSDEELKKNRFFDLFAETSSVQKSQSILEGLLNGHIEKDQHDVIFKKKDGSHLFVSIIYSLLNKKMASTVYSVQINDLTDQKLTKDYLSYSEKLSSAGQLAAGIAHEVKNPLTAIKGFIQLMLRNGNTEEYLSIIESEVSRMETMLNEFLQLGKPKQFNLIPIDFITMLKQVITLLQTQAILKLINLELDLKTHNLPKIVCDESRIKQVFINIIKNAIEATNNQGNVTVTLEQDKDMVVTTIKDEGPGIPEENLASLGRPFFSTKKTGTGLGLMMSIAIIKEHNGKIEFSNLSDGTVVQVSLPIM